MVLGELPLPHPLKKSLQNIFIKIDFPHYDFWFTKGWSSLYVFLIYRGLKSQNYFAIGLYLQ